MNTHRKNYAAEVYRQYHAADQSGPDRLNRWRSIEPESAELLAVLLKATQAKNILEIGTSGGYSTLWLADAAEHTGGTVLTLDIDAARQQLAAQHLSALNLAERCTFVCQDAAEFLQSSQTPYDFILPDAERPAYPAYWPHLKRALARPGSLLAVDNVLSHAEQVRDFTDLVKRDDAFESTVLPVGAGLLLAVRQ